MLQQIGGVKIGRDISKCWNIAWPFARIFVDENCLDIRVFLFGVTKKYRFAREEIVGLRVQKATFSRVLVIEHRTEIYAKFIAFEAFPARHLLKLIDELQKRGYSVLLEK